MLQGMTSPTPTVYGGRLISIPLRDAAGEAIGSAAIRLVLTPRAAAYDPAAWAITHGLGTPAGGTHTEVVFVDASAADLPERLVDDLVRHVAHEVYGRRWAFHYRPAEVPASVLAYGTVVRERVEVSAVEVWT